MRKNICVKIGYYEILSILKDYFYKDMNPFRANCVCDIVRTPSRGWNFVAIYADEKYDEIFQYNLERVFIYTREIEKKNMLAIQIDEEEIGRILIEHFEGVFKKKYDVINNQMSGQLRIKGKDNIKFIGVYGKRNKEGIDYQWIDRNLNYCDSDDFNILKLNELQLEMVIDRYFVNTYNEKNSIKDINFILDSEIGIKCCILFATGSKGASGKPKDTYVVLNESNIKKILKKSLAARLEKFREKGISVRTQKIKGVLIGEPGKGLRYIGVYGRNLPLNIDYNYLDERNEFFKA